MRPIPAGFEDLIKGGKMIGADRPAHEVTVEGQPAPVLEVNDPTNWTEWRTFVSKGEGNVCETSDGRAVAIYSESGDAKIAFAPTLLEILNNTEAFDTANAVTLKSGLNNPSVSINLIEGKLHAVICDMGVVSTSPVTAEFWRDTDGTGVGFAKVSDITTNNGIANSSIDVSNIATTIHLLGNGNLVCVLPWFGSGWQLRQAYYSADQGATWTAGAQMGLQAGANSPFSMSKSIAVLTDTTFMTLWVSSGGQLRFAHWTNSGASYAKVTPNFDIKYAAIATVGEKSYLIKYDSTDYLIYEASSIDINELAVAANWTLKKTFASAHAVSHNTCMLMTTNYLLATHSYSGVTRGSGTEIEIPGGYKLPVKSISISRAKDSAAMLDLLIDNKNGVYSPDKLGDWNRVLISNKEITVNQGYGSELPRTFTGLIDYVEPGSWPHELRVVARDKYKLLLDQHITNPDLSLITEHEKHTVIFKNELIEDIVSTLACWAGFAPGDIIVRATGLIISEIGWSWGTYAEAIKELGDIAGNFKGWTDEDGVFYFEYDTDRQPEGNELIVLSGTTQVELEHKPIVSGSQRVTNADQTVSYSRNVDYTIEFATGEIARTVGSSIPDGGTVRVRYVFPAWIFREGEDIWRLKYRVGDTELYRKVVVHGKAGDDSIIEAVSDFTAADYNNVLGQKVLRIPAPDLDTLAKCQTLADRMTYVISSKVRNMPFEATAIPHLQNGDCIQVLESSVGISEIYRIVDLSSRQEPGEDGIYKMNITAYHYGYAPAV